MKHLIILLASVSCVLHCNAQENRLKKAEKLMDLQAYAEAIEYYEAIVDNGLDSSQVAKNVASAYYELRDPQGGEEWYAVVVQNEPEPTDYLRYAQMLKSNGKYEEAQAYISKYKSLSQDENPLIDEHLSDEDYYVELAEKSRRYTIKSEFSNPLTSDFAPVFYGEKVVFCSDIEVENGAIKRENKTTNRPFVNLYQARTDSSGAFFQITHLAENLTSEFHEGPATFSKKLDEVYFTRSNVIGNKKRKASDNQIKLQIFHSKRTDTGWSEPEEFVHNNIEYSVGHPALSADGKTLYFVSDMKGGHGGTDIWQCQLIDGAWSQPENLGSRINTSADEMFPFIHSDGSLYFSSDGHLGLGGLDVFECRPASYGFKSPVNLQAPINSKKDDFGFTANPEKTAGYVSSNRKENQKSDDIYHFTMVNKLPLLLSGKFQRDDSYDAIPNSTEVRIVDEHGIVLYSQELTEDGEFNFEIDPKYENFTIQTNDGTGWLDHSSSERVANISEDEAYLGELDLGNVILETNALHYEGVPLADDSSILLDDYQVTVFNKSTGKSEVITISSSGELSLDLDPNSEYELTFSKEGWLTQNASFNSDEILNGQTSFEDILNFTPTKIELGETLAIENINYDYNKSDIREDAQVTLDRLVQVLQENPNINIEIGSHTDSRGGSRYNYRLSQRRAKAALKYLADNGISKKRLTWKGYGEKLLKNKCKNGVNCEDQDHEENRRTEFKIVGI